MNAAAIQLLIELASASHKLSTRLREAHAAGRELTADELDDIVAGNDAARERLQAEIDAARDAEP